MILHCFPFWPVPGNFRIDNRAQVGVAVVDRATIARVS